MTESIAQTLASLSIDSRQSVARKKPKVLTQSIVDRETTFLREKLQDPTLGSRMVAKIIQNLSEKQIADIVDYVERKSSVHKGKAFVKLCSKMMDSKAK